MQMRHKCVKNGITESVRAVAFSPQGKSLVVMDNSNEHNVAVYNVESGACIASAKGDRGKLIELAWSSEEQFAAVGAKVFKQFSVSAGSIRSRKGQFGGNNQMIGSIAYHGQVALTGCKTGELFAWNNTTLSKVVNKNHSS